RPPISTLLPYPTLFRSRVEPGQRERLEPVRERNPRRVELGPDRGGDGVPRLGEHGGEQRLLVGEVVVDRASGDAGGLGDAGERRSEEHTSELQSRENLV